MGYRIIAYPAFRDAGLQDFATGDRVQFTGNGRTQPERDAGLTNGRVGTITGLEVEGGVLLFDQPNQPKLHPCH